MKNINKIIICVLVSSILLQPITTFAFEKKETIISSLNHNGTTNKVVVNNHLLNFEQKEIEDETVLKSIMNLNGNEKFNLEGNKLTWYSKGRDIYYQGKTEMENPIKINIKYYLNGKEMTPKKMLGKSGKIDIKINLENNEFNSDYNLHTPFVVTLGTSISNKNNYNIEVSNGSVVDTGNNSMVVALASPGLYNDLKIAELEKLNEISINYSTNSFSLNNIYFVATPKLLEKVDVNKINQLNTLVNSINTISKNMDKLELGSNTLVSSLGELKNGTNKVKQGAYELNKELNNLKKGIEMLDKGTFNLNQGLVYMYEQVSSLNKMIIDMGITDETINNLNTLKVTDENLYNIKNIYFSYGLKDLNEDNINNLSLGESEKLELIKAKRFYEEKTDLVELASSNYPAIKSFSNLITYTSKLKDLEYGLKSAIDGSSELSLGFTTLKSGTCKLVEGSSQLFEGANQLDKGTDAFMDGAKTLNLGMEALNKQGIKVLNNYAKTIDDYLLKSKKLVKLSKNYIGFASDNANSTIFIYKVKSAT